MFSYIKAYGNYPPGLFAHECREGQKGLDCSLVKIANSSNISSSVHVAAPHPMLLISIIGFFGIYFLNLWEWHSSFLYEDGEFYFLSNKKILLIND